jgi:alpha-ketoglutarate-dependent taurine dioxygenase
MSRDNQILLEEKGWIEFKSGSSDFELLEIASNFGKIQKHPNGQLIFSLKPKLESESIKGTFSNICGLHSFPFHTDLAFSKIPARYILMHSEKPSTCDTTLLHKKDLWELLSNSERNNAKRAIYLVKTKMENFFTSFIFNENNESGIKYDSSCMFPFNKHAKEFDPCLKEVITQMKPLDLKWTKGKTVVIDNWMNLHGRKSALNDINRELKRIYINKI